MLSFDLQVTLHCSGLLGTIVWGLIFAETTQHETTSSQTRIYSACTKSFGHHYVKSFEAANLVIDQHERFSLFPGISRLDYCYGGPKYAQSQGFVEHGTWLA